MIGAAQVLPWMLVAAHQIIHGKLPHSNWTGARPDHVPEEACEWAAMAIAEAFTRGAAEPAAKA